MRPGGRSWETVSGRDPRPGVVSSVSTRRDLGPTAGGLYGPGLVFHHFVAVFSPVSIVRVKYVLNDRLHTQGLRTGCQDHGQRSWGLQPFSVAGLSPQQVLL